MPINKNAGLRKEENLNLSLLLFFPLFGFFISFFFFYHPHEMRTLIAFLSVGGKYERKGGSVA